ncbi:cytochrome c oxidase subunit 4 [Pseudoclavibacter chungangensis]|uniref:Cytochrome c oxidase polypeptide 4 n=1 Tax=Pseudoclavibacter chungangensis TaxID=587635 RepID=A0A7J5BZP0_9MICO|nr:cytochrome c oxidase subunit 4 [Pseudoclavibacter chungangensis]KAB1660125.1 cytochrome c oxidase subunit 4 [Pseudoclavibacter chungangensis]NYJ66768.1 ribose/xylose/arabinose/galactoside ABC-type transport system permease subunit [Pseudoclavibacter chungangensis]
MKTISHLLWILSGFYVVVAVVYTLWTLKDDGFNPEWVGVVTLFLSAAFTAFVAFYLGVENKPFKLRILPEDRLDGEIDEADYELGHFSPWSWWPIVLAASICVVLIGAAVGWWITFFAAPILVVALFGWVFEYYRGVFKH